MKLIHANIVQNKKILEAEVRFDNKIRSIKILSDNLNPNIDFLLPGFIDLHIHGGGGVDVMDEGDLSQILTTHAKHGTTSLLLTTVTADKSKLENTFHNINIKKNKREYNESSILGIHLEGPYINPEKIGAQPQFIRACDLEEIKKLNQISPIKIITLAPELLSSIQLKELLSLKVIVQLGHSNASYEESVNAFKAGAKGTTHLFNAMGSFHHRSPGLVGATLAESEFSEIIPDLIHVHPGAIKMALRAIPKLYFVTDATSATGMTDGEYKLGSHSVYKCGNGVKLKDGTLAGSTLTMYEAFLNLIGEEIGLSIAEASYRLSTIQSELLGIENQRGSINENLFSDLIVIDQNYKIKKIYIEGEDI